MLTRSVWVFSAVLHMDKVGRQKLIQEFFYAVSGAEAYGMGIRHLEQVIDEKYTILGHRVQSVDAFVLDQQNKPKD